MKFYNLLIKYRLWAGVASLVIGLVLQFGGLGDIWAAIIFYTLSFIAVFTHFFIGPLRLVQEPMENGDMEEVERIINTVWFPGLLFKPIRSTFYTLKGNIAMMNKDFDGAEQHLKKSASIGSTLADIFFGIKIEYGKRIKEFLEIKVETEIEKGIKIELSSNTLNYVLN
jgi:hypothetical protein